MFKKAITAVLVVGLGLLVLGTQVNAITLRYVTGASEHSLASKAWVKVYEERNPGVKIVFERLPYQGLKDKFLIDFISETAEIDIGHLPYGWLQPFALGGWLEPLDGYIGNPRFPDIDWDDFAEPFVKQSTVRGQVLAMPTQADYMFLWYREDLFKDPVYKAEFRAKYGRELKVPEYWDEFADVAEFFTRDTDADGRIDLYGTVLMLEKAEGGGAATAHFYPLLWCYGGRRLDENYRPMFNREPGVKAAKMLKRLFSFNPADSIGYATHKATTFFGEGKAAMLMSWPYVGAYVADPVRSKIVGKVGVALIPRDIEQWTVVGGWGEFINKHSKHKDEAYRLLAHINSKEGVKFRCTYVEKEGGLPCTNPVRISVAKDPEVIEKYIGFKMMAKAAPTGMVPETLPENFEMGLIITEELHRVLLEDKDPKQALDAAMIKVYELMKEGGYYK